MAMKREDKRHQFLLNLAKTSGIITKTADRFFKSYGVTSVQYNVLVVLKYDFPKIIQADLGKKLVVSRANVTGIIDRLTKLGYVERTPGAQDRRVKCLGITRKGLDLIKDVEKTYFKRVCEITSSLGDVEIKKAQATLNRLNLEE